MPSSSYLILSSYPSFQDKKYKKVKKKWESMHQYKKYKKDKGFGIKGITIGGPECFIGVQIPR